MVKSTHMPYCMKCKKKVQPKNPKIGKTKNKRNVLRGTCPTCGTKLNRFLANSDTKETVGI